MSRAFPYISAKYFAESTEYHKEALLNDLTACESPAEREEDKEKRRAAE